MVVQVVLVNTDKSHRLTLSTLGTYWLSLYLSAWED